ncbi:putative folate-biopterin transporter 7 [Camellia lanceoleosa]|uniref:Folate-biopterin transporter 7 n=1 Tax=Camellia lanceoleosa TaxID=1840588 RepID=A0ACC0FS59_9ERIC|nr:putative folate-biopterin transporter 7 [Camellia lanceoleosa]
MRCFPWMGVNFFLKDGLKVDSSSLQLLQNFTNLSMVTKPIYGLFSDSVYIASQHRIPYIAIGSFLQAVSWIAIAIPSSNISFFKIILYLLLGNVGASIVEVASDAIVAETRKQPSASSKNSQMSLSGELQFFVWIASSIGRVLRNMLSGVAVDRFSPQAMFFWFGIILVMQFFITVLIRESSLNLPKSPSNVRIKRQLSELLVASRKPEIAHSITWFALSYAIIPALTDTMFFYQMQHLEIDSSVLGVSKVFGQVAMLLWGVVYN